MKKSYSLHAILIAFIFVCTSINLNAQCLNCGNGADGAYHATTNTTLISGTYNYTSFTIDQNLTVTVTGSAPLVIYCSGPVAINGILNASGGNGTDGIISTSAGVGGIAVAAGSNGGDGIYNATTGPYDGLSGFGSGAGGGGSAWSGGGGAGYETAGDSSGNAAGGFGGPAYSNAQLNPYSGGSGGGGGSGGYACGGGGGGAGGGLIEIHSCDSIVIGANGSIVSNGGNGGSDGVGNCGGGGGGSGGTVYLLTSGTFTNNGMIICIPGIGGTSNVPGSPNFGTGANGKNGRIRCDYLMFGGIGGFNPILGYTGSLLTSSNSHTDETTASANDGTATVTAFGGTGSYTYLWTPGNQTTSVIGGLDAGTYTCTVTDSVGCTISIVVTVGTMSGIFANSTELITVNLFPNPASEQLQISISSLVKSNVSMEVYNLVGEKVDVVNYGNVNRVNMYYNTTSLSNGIYFFRISSGGEIVTRKITVSH